MRVVRTVSELRDALRPARREHSTIGFVPTMGALHAGHEALMEQARRECDVVVLSIFVNPTQFNDPTDLERYPRTEEADVAAAERAGVDLVFAPFAQEMYPRGATIEVRLEGPLVDTLEGAHRGSDHFHGVTTVVAKLFNIVQPDVAYFGQKDAQQVLVVTALVRELNFPVRIQAVQTVREPDGLAMSSRNVHVQGRNRERALALKAGLDSAQATYDGGERDADAVIAASVAAMASYEVDPEYLAIVDRVTLEPLRTVEPGALVVVAAPVGPVRLIDNATIH
ncbi:pantoate--beta-alanine ligase [Luteipulveratus sp. YIM 133132]|uniref:pantoate--beta-alanine ligase n=1 Tax=Luteipulveratus flavus TaxID=3031728 RepID=UPI0023AE7CAA|nr:pantoate--beta-alanine ligase [Luteipulveratus sp. YIM 133132]MDE9366545.1 pantoate--beta-alanine ligase [Luteipulveratus sp. YIM 133132]